MKPRGQRIRELKVIYGKPGLDLFKVAGPADVDHFLRPMVEEEARECFLVMNLDHKMYVNSWRLVSIGTVSEAMIHPREVFAGAILSNASAIIVAHNHPSGTLVPSKEDKAATQRLKEAGEIIGIDVLDHVIIGSPGYYSFKEAGDL
jgi:DNA repair protein RadC